ncbi:MAG: hypothetical protein LBV46_00605 [Bacteroidales bacterium]|jgi:hypothetical protein|nr:hypothetical protein [Bacteroidales bacterium]
MGIRDQSRIMQDINSCAYPALKGQNISAQRQRLGQNGHSIYRALKGQHNNNIRPEDEKVLFKDEYVQFLKKFDESFLWV